MMQLGLLVLCALAAAAMAMAQLVTFGVSMERGLAFIDWFYPVSRH